LGCPDNDKSSFLNNKRSQDVFEAALTSALYSILMDEYVTAICLFEYQEIKIDTKKADICLCRCPVIIVTHPICIRVCNEFKSGFFLDVNSIKDSLL
jgi:hypothetical protein